MAAGDIVTNLLMNNRGFVSGARGGQAAMGGLVGTVRAGATAIYSALAPLAGVFGTIFATRAALTGVRTQIQAEQRLAAVLNATGMAAGLSADQIKQYASERQALTNIGDNDTISGAAVLATFKEIRGDTFFEAMTAAQDLSTVLGTNLQSAAIQLGKALNDPIRGVSALSEAGVSFTEQQREQIRVMQEAGDIAGAQKIVLAELRSEFGGAAEAVVDDWTQAKNTLGDVAENIGHLLLPSVNAFSQGISQQMGLVAGNTAMFKEMGTIAASVFTNMGTVGELAWAQIQLGVVRGFSQVQHFFTEVIPELLRWFGDNWGDFWFSAFDLVTTVFTNLGENIRRIMTEIWDWIASGGTDSLEIAWKPLTEGFVNTLKEMPDIPDRIVGDLERQLMNDVDSLNNQLAEAISTDLIAAQSAENARQFAAGMMQSVDDMEMPGGSEEKSQGRAETSAAALDARSREAVSAVARAFNDSRSPAVRIAERQLSEQQDMNDHLEDIALAIENNGLMAAAF